MTGDGSAEAPYVVADTATALTVGDDSIVASDALTPESIDRADLSSALTDAGLGEDDDFYTLGGSGEYVAISEDLYGALAPVLTLDLSGGLAGSSGFVGIRLSVEDAAGNEVFVDTPTDQILIDLIADEGSETGVNGGLVTSVVEDAISSGISKWRAETFRGVCGAGQ